MTPTKLRKLRDINRRLEAAFAPHSRAFGTEFNRLRETIVQQERDHRKFADPRRYHPISHAVEYFVAKVILDGNGGTPPKSWREVIELREDYVQGAAIAEALAASGWTPSQADLDFFASLDYGTDCVRVAA